MPGATSSRRVARLSAPTPPAGTARLTAPPARTARTPAPPARTTRPHHPPAPAAGTGSPLRSGRPQSRPAVSAPGLLPVVPARARR